MFPARDSRSPARALTPMSTELPTKQQQQRHLQQIGQQHQRQCDDTQFAAIAASASLRQADCADLSAKFLLACICKVLLEQAVIYIA